MVDVSAIIVNYNSGAYTVRLIECLRHQTAPTASGEPGSLEILVVENDSPDDQDPWLRPLEEHGVRVLRAASNLGYAGGCNLGAREARGRHLLFLNPDLLVLPGAIEHLARHLDRHPGSGLVGPRGWLDPHGFFHLPRIELPTLTLHFLEAWRRTSRTRAERFARRRTRHALRIWCAEEPQEEPVLAGFAIMLPAPLARELGPFDERFPLYYEDADLTRRVREAGYACTLVPEAAVVHLFNKSAGQFEQEAMRKHDISQERYFAKHYGPAGRWLAGRITRWVRRHGTDSGAHTFTDPVDLGPLDAPPVFDVSSTSPEMLCELTIDPIFTLAVGRRFQGARFEIPAGVWDHLEPTRYYVRFLDLPDLRSCGAWIFEKRGAVRPLSSYQEFLQCIGAAEPVARRSR